MEIDFGSVRKYALRGVIHLGLNPRERLRRTTERDLVGVGSYLARDLDAHDREPFREKGGRDKKRIEGISTQQSVLLVIDVECFVHDSVRLWAGKRIESGNTPWNIRSYDL